MSKTNLNIVHCFRSPLGGIFRHVRDLVRAQHEAGHQVGIICDSSTGGDYEDGLFAEIEPYLGLGLQRIPMKRAITPVDLVTLFNAYRHTSGLKPDIIHSHGAKGGAYGRIIGTIQRLGGRKVARLYCPHGGTIHYDASTFSGWLYFRLERLLERMTDRLIFVSEYERQGYEEKVGKPNCETSLIYNGLGPEEFEPVDTAIDAADFLYIGMMRDLKGPDVFLQSISDINKKEGRKVTARFVGDGPDIAKYIAMISKLGLQELVKVESAKPAREAFATAKVVVIPSRAESMPYIILEAIAAHRAIVATNVGGVPEIFIDEVSRLAKPGDADSLQQKMLALLDSPTRDTDAADRANKLKSRFSVSVMSAEVDQAYRASL